MKAKDFLKLIESGKDVRGMFIVPKNYICAGFVPGSGGTLKVWGYYPYKLEKISFTISGKLDLNAILINKIGTTYEHNDFLTSGKTIKIGFDKFYEFYETEEEAIHECHLRNRGKMGPGPCCNFNMEETLKKYPQGISNIFY